MKKLTLLFCALIIAFGANGGQQYRLPKSLNAARDIRAERTHVRSKHFKGIQKQTNALKAPKVVKEIFTVDVASVDYDFDPSYGEVTYKIFNIDSTKVFKFDILVADGLSDVESGVTYTLDDMYSYYCYWENPNNPMEYGDYTAASFTKTVAADGSYTLVASATDNNGDTYNINYSGSAYVPQTYEITIGSISSSYYDSTSEVYYQLLDKDNQYAFYFDIFVEEGQKDVVSGKVYTLADMSSYSTYGYRYADYTNLNFSSASFVKTAGEDGAFTIAASVTTPKGDIYNLSYSQGAPTVREDTLTLDGTFMQNEYMWMLSAADEDTTVYVSLVVYEPFVEGTYTETKLDGYYSYIATFGADTTYFNLIEASIAVTAITDTTYTAIGTMLVANEKDPTDHVLYTLNLTATEVKVPQGGEDNMYPKEAEADFNQTFNSYDIDDSYLEEYGSEYVVAMNEDNYYIVLDVTLPENATELVAGEYPINETYGYQTVYSGYYSTLYGEVVPSLAAYVVEEDDELYYDKIWWIVSGTVTIDENKTITVDAFNSIGQSVKAVLNPTADAVENVVSKSVATKRIENGHLVIEKNGRRYNVLGAEIK